MRLQDTQELNGLKVRSAENTAEATKERELFDKAVETAELEDSIVEAKRASEMGTFDGLRFVKPSLSIPAAGQLVESWCVYNPRHGRCVGPVPFPHLRVDAAILIDRFVFAS